MYKVWALLLSWHIILTFLFELNIFFYQSEVNTLALVFLTLVLQDSPSLIPCGQSICRCFKKQWRSAMFVCAAACATIEVSTPIASFLFKSILLSYFQNYHLHRPMSVCPFRFKNAEITCVGASDRPQEYQQTLDVQSCLFCNIMLGTIKPRSKGVSFLHMFVKAVYETYHGVFSTRGRAYLCSPSLPSQQ